MINKNSVIILLLIFISIPVISCKHAEPPEKISQEKALSISDPEPQMEDIKVISLSKSDSVYLLESWKKIMNALQNNNAVLLKNYSSDTISCNACKSFPKGTSIYDIPVRLMLPVDFLHFYRDSFLFPKILQYFSNEKYKVSISLYDEKLLRTNDSTVIYSIRFSDPSSIKTKRSLNFKFVKRKAAFVFFGLYL